METKYLHLQEVLDRINQSNKEIKDNKAYQKVIEGLGMQSFFSDQINKAGQQLNPAGEKHGETN